MILKKTNLAKHILVQCMSITTFLKKNDQGRSQEFVKNVTIFNPLKFSPVTRFLSRDVLWSFTNYDAYLLSRE